MRYNACHQPRDSCGHDATHATSALVVVVVVV
jgi:hypothetical protein